MGDDWLEVTQGPAAGERLDVVGEVTVGRAQPGPACLAGDPQLSRTHARFWRAAGGQLLVEDLGSSNGTFVEGERIERPAVLGVGDTVKIGGTTLVVRGERPPGPTGLRSGEATRIHAAPGPVGTPTSISSAACAPLHVLLPTITPPGSRAPGGPPPAVEAPRSRLLRPMSLLVMALVVAVVGLSIALATRGGSESEPVLRNSTVVEPLFPVTNLNFSGKVATVKSRLNGPDLGATIDWGDGSPPTSGTVGGPIASGNGTYTQSVSAGHTYTNVATYAVTVRITSGGTEADSASNLAVVTNCLCVARLPTLARSVDLGPVSGQVLIKLPGASTSVPLTAPREIPIGTQLDATHGSLVVMAATTVVGKLQAGLFEGGLFQLLQTQDLGGLVELEIPPPNTAGCVAGNSSRVLSDLTARVSGSFRTDGRYLAATVRGTEWTTAEQCDGTLTRVQQGVVQVRNLRTAETVAVSAGHTYLARK